MKKPHHIVQEPVQKALNEYKKAWSQLLDETTGNQMMQRHARELDAEIDELKQTAKKLQQQRKNLGDDNTPANKAESDLLANAIRNVENRITPLQKVKGEIHEMDSEGGKGTYLEKRLKPEADKVLKQLARGIDAVLSGNKENFPEHIKKFYGKSRPETWDRYASMDTMHSLGLGELAFNQKSPEKRAYELAKIPREIRRAHWKVMLAHADAAYKIGNGTGGEEVSEPMDDNRLTLLASLYSRLSDNERGADNPHMPQSHKLRHNPAIHSVHVVALADKIFHHVENSIRKDHGIVNGHKKEYLKQLGQMRAQIFQAALVHDMGEIDGELSQGIAVAHMTDDKYKKAFGELREKREEETFVRHLDARRDRLHHIEKGVVTDSPITDKEWQAIRESFIGGMKLAESTDIFLGRLHKTLERLQSQQDYLRYQEINKSKPLKDSDLPNKIFSINYVPSVFYDSPLEASQNGKHNLHALADIGENPMVRDLQSRLAMETERELRHLMEQNIRSYFGEISPEAMSYQKLVKHKMPQRSGVAG